MNWLVGRTIQRYPYRPPASKLKDKKITSESKEKETEAEDNKKILEINHSRPRCDSNAQSLVPKTNALTIRPRGR